MDPSREIGSSVANLQRGFTLKWGYSVGPTPPRSVAQGISFLHSFFEPDIFSVIKIGKNLKSSFWSHLIPYRTAILSDSVLQSVGSNG